MQGMLLDLLSQKTGHFISDLRMDPQMLPALFSILAELTPEEYPLEQWRQCLEYLMGGPIPCQSYQEVAALLADCRYSPEEAAVAVGPGVSG